MTAYSRRCPIVTTLNLNTSLVKEAIKLGKFRTRQEAVNAALAEFVQLQKRRALIDLAGTIAYGPARLPNKSKSRKKRLAK
jgi:hypothetical protein